MFTDLTVLILTIIGLYRVPGRSSLWKMVFQQGQAPLDSLVALALSDTHL